MNSYNYSVYDPNGNITILVDTAVPEQDRPSVGELLMKKEPAAEQTGFVSFDSAEADIVLNMAGGEFCANATLCAAAHYKKSHPTAETVRIKVSGAKAIIPVEISETDGVFTATETLPVPEKIETKIFSSDGRDYELPIVYMDGIYHIIAPENFGRHTAEKAIAKWCKDEDAPALGIMLLSEEPYKMTPLVYVPAAKTLFFENSCGSGTCAAGVYLANKAGKEITAKITQPGGALTVNTAPDGKIRLTGEVTIRFSPAPCRDR